jgi:hypothetical protein
MPQGFMKRVVVRNHRVTMTALDEIARAANSMMTHRLRFIELYSIRCGDRWKEISSMVTKEGAHGVSLVDEYRTGAHHSAHERKSSKPCEY